MNRFAGALVAASAVALGFGGTAAAEDPPLPIEIACLQNGASTARLFTTFAVAGGSINGVTSAPVGIKIPVGAIVTSVEVETYDDYDEEGLGPDFDRVVANQLQEQVVVFIGDTQVGGPTTDVPEVGPGGSTRKASVTTKVLTGGKVSASGDVTVRHVGNTSSPNSLRVRKVTVNYDLTTTDCGTGYPVTTSGSASSTSSTGGSGTGGGGSGTDPGTAAPTGVIAPTAGSGSSPAVGSGAVVPAAGTPTAVLPASASATPVPAGSALPTGNAALPATGSDSVNLLQLGAAAAAAGLGMLIIANFRRRQATVRAN